MKWHYEQLDKLMGEWESTAKIKDGESEEIVRLPNLAEAIREIFTLILHNHTRVDTTLNIVTHIMIENAAIKQQGSKCFKAVMAIIDWMSLQHKEEIEEIPLTFDPSKSGKFKVSQKAICNRKGFCTFTHQ
jgi:hypothetical protein